MANIPPVRCYTCGKVLPYASYEKMLQVMTPEQAFSELGLRRYCCKMRIHNVPKHITKEIYANEEVSKNIRSVPLLQIEGSQASSLNPS